MESNSLSMEVEFTISCRKLKNLDVFSKSDPQVHVFENNQKVGQTEKISNNLNPDFSTTIKINYFFEKH